jgi:hypothetical protein
MQPCKADTSEAGAVLPAFGPLPRPRSAAPAKRSLEVVMNRFVVAWLCCTLAPAVWAAPKDCEELKTEIEAKIQARAVASYTLEIVSNDEVHDQNMVVGTCDNGTRKIIYQRNDR